MSAQLFRCVECGSSVVPKTGKGRVHEYRRGLDLPVPASFPIATCSGCQEIYMTAEENAELDKHLKPLYAAWQSEHLGAIVAKIKQAHGVTLRQIEGACGVTSTYLSHVLKGRKEASATLRNLLEVYAAVPEEFRMRVTGKMVSAGHANELNTNSVPLFGGTIALYFKPIAYKNVSQLRDRFSNADAANEEFAA